MRFVMFMFVLGCVEQSAPTPPATPMPSNGDYDLEWHLDWCDQPCPVYALTSSKVMHVAGYDRDITPPVNGTLAFDAVAPEMIVGSGPPNCLRVLALENREHIDLCPTQHPDMLWAVVLIDGAGVLQENWLVLASLRH